MRTSLIIISAILALIIILFFIWWLIRRRKRRRMSEWMFSEKEEANMMSMEEQTAGYDDSPTPILSIPTSKTLLINKENKDDRKRRWNYEYKPPEESTRVFEHYKPGADNNLSNVALSLSSPRQAMPDQDIVIRFTAYPEDKVAETQAFLKEIAPADKHLMGLDTCKWKLGTKISIRLYSEFFKSNPEPELFTWEGKMKLLNFDVSIASNVQPGKHIDIKADVSIAGIVIAKLRSTLEINMQPADLGQIIKGRSYQSAFASYSSKDNDIVINRLAEIDRNGVKVFWDRLSLHAGEFWKEELKKAIVSNEMFLLFWSSNAKASAEVEWEWKTALEQKGIMSIEPHPLEDPNIAPPPEELKELHFDDKYLYFRKRG